MKKIKGCLNEVCVKKKIKYKNNEIFCPHCGDKLAYICKKCCEKQIDENSKKNVCIRCEAIKKDRKDKIKSNCSKIGIGLAVVGPGVLKIVKELRSKDNKK